MLSNFIFLFVLENRCKVSLVLRLRTPGSSRAVQTQGLQPEPRAGVEWKRNESAVTRGSLWISNTDNEISDLTGEGTGKRGVSQPAAPQWVLRESCVPGSLLCLGFARRGRLRIKPFPRSS